MKKLSYTTLKLAVGPALGVLGTVVLLMYPEGHAAFCSVKLGGLL